MVIGSERHAALMDALTGRTALRWTEVAQHVPEPLAERATSAADRAGVDVVVAVGGGSAIGLAKAIALHRPVPDRRGPDDVRGLRGHQRLGPDRTGRQAHRQRRPGAARDGRLRPGPGRLDAAGAGRRVRPQRGRALRRRDVGAARRPDRRALAVEGLRALNDRPARRRRRRRHPVRLLPRRGRVRLGRLRAAPQDLPRARRPVRPAARGDARDRAAVRARLQRAGRPGRRRPDRRRARRRSTRWPACRTCARTWTRRGRCADSACARRTCRRRSTPSCRRCRRATRGPSTPAALTRLLRAAWAGRRARAGAGMPATQDAARAGS